MTQHDGLSHEGDSRADEGEEEASSGDGLRPWVSPRLEELPPLRDLTLQEGDSVTGTESVFD